MELLSGKRAAERVQNIVSPKYQVHAYAVDLSVRNIYALDPVGQVDFGGSEYRAAGKIELARYRAYPEDTYEWWDLGRGSYLVEYNESFEFPDDEFGLLEPDERLQRAGASHATQMLRGRIKQLEVLLTVDTMRVRVKQNARVSRLRLFHFSPATPTVIVVPPPAAKPRARKKGRRK